MYITGALVSVDMACGLRCPNPSVFTVRLNLSSERLAPSFPRAGGVLSCRLP